MKAVTATAMSRAAYLEQSLTWSQKHEWINSEIYAMAGGSLRHNAITMNVGGFLINALSGTPCRPTSSDQRIFVEATEACLYPDVTVVCGPFLTAPDDPQAVINPTLIVEVLSPSTRTYDLGAKLGHYLRIDTVQHVLFVEADEPHCILYSRSEEGWLRRDIQDGNVPLEALDVAMPVAAIYANLDAV